MKNKMPKRSAIGKISTFLSGLKRKGQQKMNYRRQKRSHLSSKAPASTKFAKRSKAYVYRTNKYAQNTNRKGMILDTNLKAE